jgi:DNA ligase-associated metallophosphoesterase
MTDTPARIDGGSCSIMLGSERVVLLPQRAAWLPDHAALLVADTHFGKSATLRASGACIPKGVTAEMLYRLTVLLDRTRAERVIVVGDLVHAPAGVTDDLASAMAAWAGQRRAARALRLQLVTGNHDTKLGSPRFRALIEATGLELLGDAAAVGGLHLRHDPAEDGPMPMVCGHTHPALFVPGSGKVPAFQLVGAERGGRLILPAFSLFTAGAAVPIGRAGQRLFAVAEDRVIPV